MNVYTANTDGFFLPGVAVVLAKDKEEALEMINNKLSSLGFGFIELKDVKQVTKETRYSQFLYFNNGDY